MSFVDASAPPKRLISPSGAAQKILIKLHEGKKIEGRISGKQSVYHTIQDLDNAPTPAQLKEMDDRTQALKDETTTLTAQAKTLRATLAQLNSSLSTADLRTQVTAMQAEKAEIEARLDGLRGGNMKPVSKEEKERIEKEMRVVGRCVDARTKIVKEMSGMILEAVGKEKWAELREDLGVDII